MNSRKDTRNEAKCTVPNNRIRFELNNKQLNWLRYKIIFKRKLRFSRFSLLILLFSHLQQTNNWKRRKKKNILYFSFEKNDTTRSVCLNGSLSSIDLLMTKLNASGGDRTKAITFDSQSKVFIFCHLFFLRGHSVKYAIQYLVMKSLYVLIYVESLLLFLFPFRNNSISRRLINKDCEWVLCYLTSSMMQKKL